MLSDRKPRGREWRREERRLLDDRTRVAVAAMCDPRRLLGEDAQEAGAAQVPMGVACK